jgi:hypothetical protein
MFAGDFEVVLLRRVHLIVVIVAIGTAAIFVALAIAIAITGIDSTVA